MKYYVLLASFTVIFVSCGLHFSKPIPQRGYYVKSGLGVVADTLRILFSVQYDSTAQRFDRERMLVRGRDFEQMVNRISIGGDSLFNFGYQSVLFEPATSSFMESAIVRVGRENMLFNDHLMPRLLFGRKIFTKVDSAWLQASLPKGDVLLLNFSFGKKEYVVEGTTLISIFLADVHFVRDGKVLYSRLWACQPFHNFFNQQLDKPGADSIEWFTMKSLERMAAAIRKDLSQKLLR